MGAADVERSVQALVDRGVTIVDPRQTYVAPEVRPERVCAGATLHPGTRLLGARTWIGTGAQVGAQGPANLVDAVLGEGARVDAGHLEGAVLLAGAAAGWGAHLRPGTLLEEKASVAHCVGLKHTILMSFVTVGSVVNFCDVLMSGGTSRHDHSEVGSGFIHFNFTPWGKRGDKATPSLVGDVVRGAFLREARIFLGGAGGMVGPRRVGFGSLAGAGQVLRRDVPEGHLVIESPGEARKKLRSALERPGPRAKRNIAYIGQLVALRAWYREVRRARLPAASGHAPVIDAAIETLQLCIDERVERLRAFTEERGEAAPSLDLDPASSCPEALVRAEGPEDHVAWVQALPPDAVEAGQAWLQAVADAVVPPA